MLIAANRLPKVVDVVECGDGVSPVLQITTAVTMCCLWCVMLCYVSSCDEGVPYGMFCYDKVCEC